ncbi:MAG: 3-deoxy-8-phosphooctulonate synthase [Pseudomonadota bacterium]
MTNQQKEIRVGKVNFANNAPVSFIVGPCQLESRQHAFDMAGNIKEIFGRLGAGFVYKSSYDKANRTSIGATRGTGLKDSMPIFEDLRKELGIPVLTDVHTEAQCGLVAPYVDVLQIPAFLCRQTDLLVAAATTGKVVNVKKGQFLAPWDIKNVAKKVADSGNEQILLTERGASFGYNTLVSDMRALPQMAETGYPVIFDATHSVQMPGGLGGSSGGDRTMVPPLARAAVAVGVAGVFIETHDDPDNTISSDGPNMVPLSELEQLIGKLIEIDQLVKTR